jgi:hypothetical protein
MRAGSISAGLLLVVLIPSTHAGWLQREKKAVEDGAPGVVVKIKPGLFEVLTADSRFITYKLNDSTLYFHRSKFVSPAQLRLGKVVTVEADSDWEGNLTASSVAFQDSRPAWRPRAQARDLLPGGVMDDALVEKARQASNSFFDVLPYFLCQQSMTRSYSGGDGRWRTLDYVTAEVIYEHGHESYRDIKLNGKSTKRKMMDLPGSRSTGEFGSALHSLFDPETQALFKFRTNTTLGGFSTAVYDLAVSAELSDWRITAGSQMIMTAYTGRIWIDRESGSVLRIEKKAVDIPAAFPYQQLQSAVDYGPVMLPAGRYFLPARAENLSCNDPRSCSRNAIEFRNYHKYVGESSITYDAPILR